MVSIIIIDSRSDVHSGWVNTAIQSAYEQTIPVEVIVIDNIGRKKTIGECWNEGVKKAQNPYIFFLGDDDYLSFDAVEILYKWFLSNEMKSNRVVCVSSYMYAFNEDDGNNFPMTRQHTGMWKKDYLLEYPFNEKLKKGIDREYIEETIKRGDYIGVITYYFGYFYRRHNDYRCAGDIIFHSKDSDFYCVTTNRIFLSPIEKKLEKYGTVFIDNSFNVNLAKKAKIIWCEFANQKAIEISNTPLDGLKVLRIHAYEAFTEYASQINWNGFDVVIFIDEYIKDYVERQFGKVNGAVIIPNGVDLEKYTLIEKPKGNKIAVAGYLTRKKGIGEVMLIAKALPEYEFHLAGRYQENDIADWMNQKKPENVFIHEWKYEEAMPEFYQGMDYVLNASMRESQAMTICEAMACGCKPIVRNWIGAEDVYKSEWIYDSIEGVKKILNSDYNPQEYRDFIKEKYDFDKTFNKIKEVLRLENVNI